MKKIHSRLAIAGVSALLATTVLTACVEQSGDSPTGEDDGAYTIGFLMPDLASTRYEQQDYPLFKAKIKDLCPECEVIYQNADADPATQQEQVNSLIAQNVDAIVLDAVDTKAAASYVVAANAAEIPIIAYDRPIPDQPADYYISFDNEGIGESIAASLIDHLDAEGAEGGLLIVNGSPTDAAAGLIKKGIHNSVDASDYKVLAEFDTPGWDPAKAQEWVSGQVVQFGDQIVGVVAANDGTGGGTIAAFKSAGITDVPPVTGNDAEVAAAQRIIAGDQYNTISKPISIVAEAAAKVAFAFASGETVAAETELYGTPSQLFTPDVVTLENIKEILFDSGIMTADEVCTAEYADACAAAGIA